MQVPGSPASRDLEWLLDLGFEQTDLHDLNLCVPGEFTMPGACYVNTGSPGVIYRGTEEGTLPLVAGRWYLIPSDIVNRLSSLRDGAEPVARARRLIG